MYVCMYVYIGLRSDWIGPDRIGAHLAAWVILDGTDFSHVCVDLIAGFLLFLLLLLFLLDLISCATA